MPNVIAINAAARHSIIAAQATSDEMLLESIADGGRTAMHILYSRHNVRVYRFILRIVRDATMAEDLVSQVFLARWDDSQIIKYDPKTGQFAGWPFGRPVWVSEIYAVLAAVPLVAYVEGVTVQTDDAGRVLTDDEGLVTGVALDADELVDATTDGLAVWDTAGDRHG